MRVYRVVFKFDIRINDLVIISIDYVNNNFDKEFAVQLVNLSGINYICYVNIDSSEQMRRRVVSFSLHFVNTLIGRVKEIILDKKLEALI
jgi:hypothetical protein